MQLLLRCAVLLKSQRRKLAIGLLVCGALYSCGAQDLPMKLVGRTYTDDKISVTAPANWTIAKETAAYRRGAVLRQGKYVLRLCTSCMQASGIVGGRFGEISILVQPWFRADSSLGFCGQPALTAISRQLNRIDLWFKRDPAHTYNEDLGDCRQPETTATVWYGSYFEEHCPAAATPQQCGGYFLHLTWLNTNQGEALAPFEEMAFGLTYEETNLDQLPHQGDAELQRVLAEASNIVRSVHYKRFIPKQQ